MGVGYITDEWDVYDGANVEHNCTNINKSQFSYNAAVLIQGLAFMYDYVSFLPPSRPVLQCGAISCPIDCLLT